MGFHTFDVERADDLEDATRYRYCSAEELVFALSPAPTDVVADLGSGTGFYTDDVAPHVGRLVAVDVQPAMHDRYREKGLPGTVAPLTGSIDALPLAGSLDAAFSTMTYHEFYDESAIAELAAALRPGGRLVLVDWSADGSGEAGPPLNERFRVDDAVEHLADADFEIVRADDRPETWLVVARTPE